MFSFADIAGKSDYIVYYTDYDNYAASKQFKKNKNNKMHFLNILIEFLTSLLHWNVVFKCQKIAVGNRQTAMILSRYAFKNNSKARQ